MMIKVVFLNGPPRSGKDTLADLLTTYYNQGSFAPKSFKKNDKPRAMKYKFADLLKVKTHRFFIDMPEHEAFSNPLFFETIKEKPHPFFQGMTPRQAYIWMSEDVIKPKFGLDYFGCKAAENIVFLKAHINPNLEFVIVADCGFIEEARAFRNTCSPEESMMVVHLKKTGTSYVNDSRNYIRPSNVQILEVENEHGFADRAATQILNAMEERWGNANKK